MSDATKSNDLYLQPTDVIDCDHDDVIRFAGDIVQEATDPVEQARRLFYAVRNEIVYGPRTPFFLPEHYRASAILKRGRGFCVPKACLLCASGRVLGIPSRLGFADIRNYGASKQLTDMMGCNLFSFHGFTEFHLNGKWIKATAAFDKPIFVRHNVAAVEFDGVNDVVYPSRNLNGDPYVEYVTSHGSFADLPLELILEGWRKHYGEDRVHLWMRAFTSGEGPEELRGDKFRV